MNSLDVASKKALVASAGSPRGLTPPTAPALKEAGAPWAHSIQQLFGADPLPYPQYARMRIIAFTE